MVQVTNTQVTQKKMNAVRTGEIKSPSKSPKKIASSLAEKVRYASLPGLFRAKARISSLLFAQVRKPGRSGKSTICIPGISKPKRAYRLTSTAKLATSKLSYQLQLGGNGVDMYIRQGGQLFRVPLDVKAKWDAKRQKVVIDGKVLKSSKLVNTFSGSRLQYDGKELGKLVKPQLDAFVYEINNRRGSAGLVGMEQTLKSLDGRLARLKKRLGSRFKKDGNVRATRSSLTKTHEYLKARLLSLISQRRKIAKLKRQKGFTSSFRKKLTSLERQNAKLRGRLITLKSKLWNLIYKYWLHKPRKRPC